VEATIVLSHTPQERPRFPPITPGNRSLLYQFESLETVGKDEGFGAIIEHAEETGDGHLVHLRFLSDLASVYATPGVPFKVWYGTVSGAGSVLRTLE
jgi:hypothetical protein